MNAEMNEQPNERTRIVDSKGLIANYEDLKMPLPDAQTERKEGATPRTT